MKWELEVSSWRGISVGASHFYGAVRSYPDNNAEPMQTWTVERPGTFTEMKEFCERTDYPVSGMEPDVFTVSGFSTVEEVILTAATIFMWHGDVKQGDDLWYKHRFDSDKDYIVHHRLY